MSIHLPSPPATISLSALTPGQGGVVRGLHAVDGFAYRLAALGFRVGRSVTVIRCAPLGGPIQIRLGTTDVMLRRTEADRIDISPI
ncbi:ferrous iron transport protein A [Gammaproteobacteria bacterium]